MVSFQNKTFWIVILGKIRSQRNFGSLKPNLALVFVHRFSIANFSISGSPETGNTVAVGENRCQIWMRPKITI